MAKNDPLLAEISALLAASEDGDDPARLERTLTDGYARALALEAEHRRLERRIGGLSTVQDEAERQELLSLLRLAKRQEGDLGELRRQLGELRRRHSSAARRVRI